MVGNFKANESKLKSDYLEACKDNDFKRLVARIKADDELARKYTSKLEECVNNLKKCSKCKGLGECPFECPGLILYPRVDGNMITFEYHECKYLKEENELKKKEMSSTAFYYNEPIQIKNASMGDIDLTDKNRLQTIKWIKDFYKKYNKDKHLKGLYLHGSFGSGKTYILAALLNELVKNGTTTVIMYYPQLLRTLKESFGKNNNESYDEMMNKFMTSDIVLFDDIGAENLTAWSRDEVLGTILQYRMDESLPTFFTSNLNIEELESHLAETKSSVDIVKAKRIIERIKSLTDDIELISKNRRV
ncbi:MAG: primosomal protein DnaI [Bacilli bacterium]|nr:primosomal protein DnaI [Bacilli bacterium]